MKAEPLWDPFEELPKSPQAKTFRAKKTKAVRPKPKLRVLGPHLKAYDIMLKRIDAGDYSPHKQMVWPGGKKPRESLEVTEERKRFQALAKKLEAQFKQDLFAAYRLSKHPKKELLFQTADRYCEVRGQSEFLSVFEDLLPLIR